jgi:peptidoglycan-associated lipoprotein
MQFRSSTRILLMVGLLVGSLALFGCPKRPEVMQAAPSAPGPVAAPAPAPAPAPPAPAPVPAPEVRVTPPPPAPAPAPAPAAPAPAPAPAASPLKDIFFDFDKSNIKDDQKAALNDDVAWLKANPSAKVLIEGHCDERGTVEYNQALGEKRAQAARDYLVAAGINDSRMQVISYGKERPFDPGHDEAAWAKNRRAQFVLR